MTKRAIRYNNFHALEKKIMRAAEYAVSVDEINALWKELAQTDLYKCDYKTCEKNIKYASKCLKYRLSK